MSDTAAATVPARGLLARGIGVVVSPGATFAAVVGAPRPAGILFVVSLVVAIVTALPQFTERGQQQVLALQRQQVERMGMSVTPEMTDALAARAPYLPYQTIVSVFVAMPVASIIIGGFCWGVFNIILGGEATFKQVLAIVTHSQVIRAVGAIAAAPIVWVQGLQSMAGPFSLGALAPTLEPSSRVAQILGGLEFFTIWQLVVVAVGLGVLYRRRSVGIAIALLIAYVAFVTAVTTAFSAAFNG